MGTPFSRESFWHWIAVLPGVCVDYHRRIIPRGWYEHEAASVLVVARETDQNDSGQGTEHDNAPIGHPGILSHNRAVGGYDGGMAYEQMADIRSKVQWAEKRINEFKIELRVFLEKNPYSLRIEHDCDGGEPFIHIIRADPIPPQISLLAGDVFQNLRSALDYLVCALVRANGKTVNANSFPIFDHEPTSSDDKRAFRRKVEGIREEIIQVIGDTHPYQGGNNTLWRLHRLNNIDKHNLLVAGWGGFTAINGLAPIVDQWIGNRWVGLSGVPFPLKEGDKFTPNVPGVKVDKNTSLFLEVALNEVGVAEGYPLVLALKESLHAVRDTVGRFSVYLR